jgi:putative nucleotidyltransferase with HDIG domain
MLWQSMTDAPPQSAAPTPLEAAAIQTRLANCPRLPSLASVNSALRDLLNADQRYTSQIAEIIRRDPSLTARLLRLVNSVYYGLSTPINNIEEAVFYLGVRQIRQLAMVTPIIEDFQKLAGRTTFRWREFWRHCIATAILTREVVGCVHSPSDEVDYVAGLVHDVGKIVMASAFPDHFAEVQRRHAPTDDSLLAVEVAVLGMDHAELGACYLKGHNLPDALVEVAHYHHAPERAGHHARLVAAVQVADLLARHAGIGDSGSRTPVAEADWQEAIGWAILFGSNSETEKSLAHASLKRSLEKLPTFLDGLV